MPILPAFIDCPPPDTRHRENKRIIEIAIAEREAEERLIKRLEDLKITILNRIALRNSKDYFRELKQPFESEPADFTVNPTWGSGSRSPLA